MIRVRLILLLVLTPGFAGATSAAEPSLRWKIKLLTVDSNEGIDVGDFNKDGKPDVIAGRNWYAAPDYVSRPVRTIEDWNGYVESNGDYVIDVDSDGWLDVIAGSFIPSQVYWYKNPGLDALRRGQMWKKNLLVDTQASQNEGQLMHDLDKDGKPEWIVNSWRKNSPMLAWRFSTRKVTIPNKKGKKKGNGSSQQVVTLKRIMINSKGNGHGMGFGDVNSDGREDIICGTGWYERPVSDIFHKAWKFHPDWNFHASVPVLVRDLNGDGRNDIIWGKGHDFGLQWWQLTAPGEGGKVQWKEHVIDNKFSQPHCLHFADLDGDGQDELITGKRVRAHNGNDPGGDLKPCMYYYKFNNKTHKFSKHVIEEGSVGTGLQIRTVDLNKDGRLDIAVAGKSGTYLLFNQGK